MSGWPSSHHQATNDERWSYPPRLPVTREGLTQTHELPPATGRDPNGAWPSLSPGFIAASSRFGRSCPRGSQGKEGTNTPRALSGLGRKTPRLRTRRADLTVAARRPLGTAAAHSPRLSVPYVNHPHGRQRCQAFAPPYATYCPPLVPRLFSLARPPRNLLSSSSRPATKSPIRLDADTHFEAKNTRELKAGRTPVLRGP